MNETSVMAVDARGRVVLPRAIRHLMGITPGDRLAAFGTKEGVVIMTMPQLEARLAAIQPQPTINLLGDRPADPIGSTSSADSRHVGPS
ncbi:MAG: AbrB/MazE/SpoVT family DNA-binding domain-containing protein [Propionibacteriaceae bacterium]|jgi:AbrB family looped-hinge helix DNA binding protein|nr:AbrB/MazE/SpoVT family DNA-binding domain-containing protein [Propionibacteriaceae bacterium]